MSMQRITSTPKDQIQSLAFRGIRVTESYHQLRDIVAKHCGESHALLFAEPSPSTSGATVDWYTTAQGPMRRVADLPPEDAERVTARIARLGQDVQQLAEQLKSDDRVQANTVRGHLLELALRYPDSSHIFLVGEQPVLTCWGFAPGRAGAQPEDLARFGQGQPVLPVPASSVPPSVVPPSPAAPPPPSEQPPAPEAAGCLAAPGCLWHPGCVIRLGWLLPLGLLALLLALLFIPFGAWNPLFTLPGLNFRLPALPGLSVPDSKMELDSLRTEGLSLEEALRKLRLLLDERAALCVPPVSPVPEIPASPALPDQPEIPRQSLSIPETRDDYAFLEGHWMSDANLRNKDDGQPITVIYAFDAQGNGTVSVRQQGKKDCVGQAKARFVEESILRIETERQICPEGNRAYAAEVIECKPAATGKTSCLGKMASGDTWGGSVYFYRMP